MDSSKKRPLTETAALSNTKYINVVDSRKFYALRKDINELRESVDKLHDHAIKVPGGHL
jgi:hypothetical protein